MYKSTGFISFFLRRFTGVMLVLYLFTHMWVIGSVNQGPEAFNARLNLVQTPFFKLAEIALLAAVVYHAFDGIRLLIVLGDGYPNDTGYKKRYAIEDTRKAIFEARSQNIYTHGITVNLTGDAKMNDLFGPVHHTAISDVRELPDKLWRAYSSLTR